MNIDAHLENLKESIREIENAVRNGLQQKQRTIGFHTSAGAADMMEIILHKENLIDPGVIIKHEWFNSKNKVLDKLPFDFPRKKEIIELICEIEHLRNTFCYGKRQDEIVLEQLVATFLRLKNIFIEVSGYEL